MAPSPATFLITAAGTGTAWAYVMTLAQQFPEVRILTADTNEASWCSAAQFAAQHRVWPPFQADERYLNLLHSVIAAEGVTHYLPIIDPEIRFAALNRASLPVHVMAPNSEFAALALAKDRYATTLSEWDIDSPRTLTSDEAAERLAWGARVFAKQPGSFGGRGTWEVKNAADAKNLPPDAFLQEGMPGPEYTADCFPLDDGDVFVSVRQRMETKSGVCTKARIAPHERIESIARTIVRATAVDTPFCFQVMTDGERFAVTDINPRLGAGTSMSAANGSDFFGAHVAKCLGMPNWTQRLQRHHQSCAVTRQYFEVLSPL